MEDSAFGRLEKLKFGWRGVESLAFFGVQHDIEVIVDESDGDGIIREGQRQAYRDFQANRERYIATAEDAILAYYLQECDEPRVESKAGLTNLVTLTSIFFPTTELCFGLLLECDWDEEHGLAVKFVGGMVTEVGLQDILI